VRAGFGTLVPTQIHTTYLRSSIACSAGGNLSLFAFPNQNNLLLATYAATENTLPTGLTASLFTGANASTLNGMFDLSRTLSMGLRIYPMIAATSVPGIVSLGCAPRADLSDTVASTSTIAASATGLTNYTTSQVNQMPYLREHIARPSSLDYFQVTWRPTDVRDFEMTPGDSSIIAKQGVVTYCPFYDQIASQAGSNLSRTNDTQGSFLVANLQGLPAGATIYYEVILHMETVDTSNPLASTDFSSTQPNRDSVAASSSFPSFESLYRSFVGQLPNVDTVAGAATSLLTSPMVRTAASRYLSNRMGVRASGYEMVSL
jgi:hypothetical protein